MLNKIAENIKQFHMIEKGDRIVVGVSGGADSVCLLSVLQKLYGTDTISLFVVHINHGLRGTEADEDEAFVKELCNQLKVECFSYSYDIKQIAASQGISEEEAGRNVRYQSFLEVCHRQKCNKIAVAHNKNDSAETFLFHLFRGSGLKGLSGIAPVRQLSSDMEAVSVIRPLTCAERSEIEKYLKEEQIFYRTDSTNLTEDYTRNKIRNRILTYARTEINQNAVNNIYETAGRLREAQEFIDEQVELSYRKCVIETEIEFKLKLKEFEEAASILQKGILRIVFERLAGHLKDFEAKHIEAVLTLIEKQVGRSVHLPYGVVAERGYEELFIYRRQDKKIKTGKEEEILAQELLIPGCTNLIQQGKRIITEIINYQKNTVIPKNSCIKWFDYDKIENAVEVRGRKEGDYIQINSLSGRKKLKDYFIDHKIPKQLRDSLVLIADGNHIMWIVGYGDRMSEKYKVDDTTTKVLLIKMIDLEEMQDER
ncbi:MAG: tRNA lysidine(34) synthetase TilS [Mobilitalea sp.]